MPLAPKKLRWSPGKGVVGSDNRSINRRTKGEFVMILTSMMNAPAWQALSGNSVKLLLLLAKLGKGNNGWGHKGAPGELFLSERQAAQQLGLSRNTVSRAFAELVEHGFLRVVRAGHFRVKIRHSTVWRLTFQPYPRAHQGPTNEWRDWKPEENPRAQKLNGSGSKNEPLPDDKALTGSENEPVKPRNGRNPPNESGSKTAPHLDIPRGGDASDPAKPPFTPQIVDGPISSGKAA